MVGEMMEKFLEDDVYETVRCIAVEGGQRCHWRGCFQNQGETRGYWCEKHVPDAPEYRYRLEDLDRAINLIGAAVVGAQPTPDLASSNLRMGLHALRIAPSTAERKGFDFREAQWNLARALSDLVFARDLVREERPENRKEFGFYLFHATLSLEEAMKYLPEA